MDVQNRTIGKVKVQWKHLSPNEATWELESHMPEGYPILFQNDSEEAESNIEDDVELKRGCL